MPILKRICYPRDYFCSQDYHLDISGLKRSDQYFRLILQAVDETAISLGDYKILISHDQLSWVKHFNYTEFDVARVNPCLINLGVWIREGTTLVCRTAVMISVFSNECPCPAEGENIRVLTTSGVQVWRISGKDILHVMPDGVSYLGRTDKWDILEYILLDTR